MQLIQAQDIPPQAWRNGGGQTRELLTWPAAHGWRVRVSLADITSDGPFSAFPGVTRWFAVVHGTGVQLTFPAGAHRQQQADDPLNFEGELAPACRLIDGPTRDLNLMLHDTRGQMCHATPHTPWHGEWAWRGFFSRVAGRLHGGSAAALTVPAQTLVWALPDRPCHFSPSEPVDPASAAPCGWWLGATPEAP